MSLVEHTKDAQRYSARTLRREAAHFAKVRNAETQYAVKLRKIARHVGDIIRAFTPGDPAGVSQLQHILGHYANVVLRPWAQSAATRMIAEVSRRDEQAWFKTARVLGRGLRQEIYNAPVGDIVRELLAQQVHYITSIPTEAAQRVHELTQELVAGGRRADEIVPLIMNMGNVTIARANLIARTETARTASALQTARAKHIGATHFVWHTARDWRVRPLHKKLEGRTFAFDDPPIIGENGQTGLPGTIFNCRCFATPVLPDIVE